eukprot:121757_1
MGACGGTLPSETQSNVETKRTSKSANDPASQALLQQKQPQTATITPDDNNKEPKPVIATATSKDDVEPLDHEAEAQQPNGTQASDKKDEDKKPSEAAVEAINPVASKQPSEQQIVASESEEGSHAKEDSLASTSAFGTDSEFDAEIMDAPPADKPKETTNTTVDEEDKPDQQDTNNAPDMVEVEDKTPNDNETVDKAKEDKLEDTKQMEANKSKTEDTKEIDDVDHDTPHKEEIEVVKESAKDLEENEKKQSEETVQIVDVKDEKTVKEKETVNEVDMDRDEKNNEEVMDGSNDVKHGLVAEDDEYKQPSTAENQSNVKMTDVSAADKEEKVIENDEEEEDLDEDATDDIWNAYIDEHGHEPKSPNQLQTFSKTGKFERQMSFKNAKAVFTEQAGKGKIHFL